MRKLLFGLLLAALAVVVPAADRAVAAYTPDDLKAATLTADEVGSGFQEMRAAPVDNITATGVANYSVLYVKRTGLFNPTFTAVVVLLLDAEAAAAAGLDTSDGAAVLANYGLTATPVDSPGIGEDSQQFAISGTIFGLKVQGDSISWRQNGVAAVLFTLSNSGSPPALPYAQAQSDKISAVLGGS